jgi:uncharacterized protein
MREITVLVKPASSSCNASCSYCFYKDLSTCRMIDSHGSMQPETWRRLVDGVYQAGYEKVIFAFQGGEPLLAGVGFFEDFVAYTQENKDGRTIEYTVQTNGILLDDGFCRIFKEYDFLVGISIDGFAENHNKHRFLNQAGSFAAVMEGVELLRRYGIEFNVLTVLTRELAQFPDKLHEFYTENRFNFVQIIPCLPELQGSNPYSLTPQLFSFFYTRFYDLWLDALSQGEYLSENLIDNVVRACLGLPTSRCGMFGTCQVQCIVEADGSVYPCDFYALDQFQLGNVKGDKIRDLLRNPAAEAFIGADNTLPKPCHVCQFRSICNGNCKRMRPTFVNDSYCGYKDLLARVASSLDLVQRSIAALNRR